jgi:hypothetical protein
MKKIVQISFLIIFLFSTIAVYAQDESPAEYEDPRWSMLKCTSLLNGTIWASFGHLMTSDEDSVVYFPAEIVIFESLTAPATRLFFPDFKKAIEAVKIRVGYRKFSMEFEAPNQFSVMQKHKITLIQYPNLKNAYMGNWALIENGKSDVMADIQCQIF